MTLPATGRISWRNPWRNGFAAIAVTGSLLLTACGPRVSAPAQTLKDFNYHIEAEETTEARELLSEDIQAMLPAEKMSLVVAEAAGEMEQRGGIDAIQIDEEEIDDDTALITFTLQFGDGSEESATERLVREEDGWRIAPEGK
jgi:hypothetical protein